MLGRQSGFAKVLAGPAALETSCLEDWRPEDVNKASSVCQPMGEAVAPVNKRIASQQGWRTGGLESSSLGAWRDGWPAQFANL